MQKNSGGIHDFPIKDAMRMAQSDAGRQLFALLQSTQGDQLRNAMDQAAAGNYDQAKKAIETLMASQQAQILLKQLQEEQNG